MSELTQTLLAAFGTSAGAVLALAFLARSLVGHRLGKDLENHKLELARDIEAHKAELKAAADRELASHKAELDRQNDEVRSRLRVDEARLQALEGKADVVFSRNHARRCELVEDIYAKLVEFVYSANLIEAQHRAPTPENLKEVLNLGGVAREAALKASVYLPRSTSADISDFITATVEAAALLQTDDPPTEAEAEARHREMQRFLDLFRSIVEPFAPSQVLAAD